MIIFWKMHPFFIKTVPYTLKSRRNVHFFKYRKNLETQRKHICLFQVFELHFSLRIARWGIIDQVLIERVSYMIEVLFFPSPIRLYILQKIWEKIVAKPTARLFPQIIWNIFRCCGIWKVIVGKWCSFSCLQKMETKVARRNGAMRIKISLLRIPTKFKKSVMYKKGAKNFLNVLI